MPNVVLIRERDEAAARQRKQSSQGRPLSEIDQLPLHAYAAVATRVFLDNAHRSIGRAVVANQEFEVAVGLPKNRIELRAQIELAIVSRQ